LTKILAAEGFCIVSGLAKGVDTIAHESALEFGAPTIAVMGTPIDQCYPSENKSLKERIRNRGLNLTSFGPGERVEPSNFPRRNALMAALSSATIVVEADIDSGTRHQVKAAIQLHRKVGFLASLAAKDYPWVTEAIRSGYGHILETSEDIHKFADELRGPVLKGIPDYAGQQAEFLLGSAVKQRPPETVPQSTHVVEPRPLPLSGEESKPQSEIANEGIVRRVRKFLGKVWRRIFR
jgi:DNA processing protein